MVQDKNPKISIITVSYNAAKTIEQTILSVVEQTYENIEYIIIDGGSTDGTVDIIKKYADRIAYWVSEPDEGIYDAMNKGIDVATGEVIGIINSDDIYISKKIIENINAFFKSNWDCDVVCGDIIAYEEIDDKVLCKIIKSNINKSEIKYKMNINHPTVFVKKSFYNIYGKFNVTYKIAADYDLMLRGMLNGAIFKYIPLTSVKFKLGGKSSSYLNTKLEVCQIQNENKINRMIRFKSFLNGVFEILYAWIMRIIPRNIYIYIKKRRNWGLICK